MLVKRISSSAVVSAAANKAALSDPCTLLPVHSGELPTQWVAAKVGLETKLAAISRKVREALLTASTLRARRSFLERGASDDV